MFGMSLYLEVRRGAPCALVRVCAEDGNNSADSSRFFPPSNALPILVQPPPPKLLQHRGDAALIRSSDPWRFDSKCFASYFSDRHPRLHSKKRADSFFPKIGFVSLRLLRHDILPFEIFLGPPSHASLVTFDGFGEQLIAIAFQRLNIDIARLNRPEPSTAGLIPQVDCAVRRANKNALPRLDDFLSAETRPIPLRVTREKRFEERGVRPAHRVHLGNFDQPLAAQVLRDILAASDVRKVIRKPSPARSSATSTPTVSPARISFANICPSRRSRSFFRATSPSAP
jgi:hypothetical protein